MLITHGGSKAKLFDWVLRDDSIEIKNENGRQENYPLSEILAVMNWLSKRFDFGWFPLANNVEKLGEDTEVDGLGVAILRQQPRDISHAQGASYLGVILEHVGLLEWNSKHRGIQWRILHHMENLDELRKTIKEGKALP